VFEGFLHAGSSFGLPFLSAGSSVSLASFVRPGVFFSPFASFFSAYFSSFFASFFVSFAGSAAFSAFFGSSPK
jgi:hypothetical protein